MKDGLNRKTITMEIFNVVKESLSLVIMGAGVIIAGMALYTWKKEFIGKKKIDLACDIIEQVCNIQDIIRYARNPAFFTNESNKIIKDFNKNKKEFNENKIHYLVARYRFYNKKEEFLPLKILNINFYPFIFF